jgi:hypothetical protein
MPSVRAALVSYFELDDLERLLVALAEAGMPPDTFVHVGTYGVRGETSELVRAQPGGRYSPIFQTGRTAAWEGRRLSPEEEELVDPRRSGPVPSLSRLLQLSSNDRIWWGVEVGRRYRDGIRHARLSGIGVDEWQLDELSPRLAGSQGRRHREFARGILRGLNFGRPVLDDPENTGWVWATRGVLRLASLPVDSELRHFWHMLDRACFRIVGEEYANFVGDPLRSASRHSDGQRALAGGGAVRRRLAARYVAGLTPGYRIGGGLGGNVELRPRAEVIGWRNAYVDARARQGVAGFAQYYFRFENARAFVMQDALGALARGMAQISRLATACNGLGAVSDGSPPNFDRAASSLLDEASLLPSSTRVSSRPPTPRKGEGETTHERGHESLRRRASS